MIKNGDFIEQMIDRGHIVGAVKDNINAASLNLTLGKEFKSFDYSMMGNISLKHPEKVKYNTYFGSYNLRPAGFVLASSLEYFCMPDNIAATLTMRSSAGRLGLDHYECGLFEPLFKGQGTFELTNNHDVFKIDGSKNETYIELNEGDIVIQAIFHEVNPVSEKYGYNFKGKYNGQRGTTVSLGI